MTVKGCQLVFLFDNDYNQGLTMNCGCFASNDGLFPLQRCFSNNTLNNPSNRNFRLDYITSISFYSGSDSPSSGGDILIIEGNLQGTVFFPSNLGNNYENVSVNVAVLGGSSSYCCSVRSFSASDDVKGISDNGEYYYNSDGDYYDVKTDVQVASSSDIENLPSGVSFNGWLLEDSIINGSDGKYYDLFGNEVMQNLPSDVTLLSQIGNIYLGDDNNYYSSNGSQVMQNLPSDVTIVSYDSQNDCYVGSDGLNYDVNGNPVSLCDGVLMDYNNTIRLEIIGVDIFGNDVSIGGNVTVGQSSVEFPQGTLIREIKRIVARNLNESSSCGFGNLTIKADVVGAKIGVDLEGFDIDGVLGQYVVANCIFDACDKYADYVMNDDLPLGFTNMTSLDVGYYCCTSVFQLFWEGFDNSEFPYCCGSYDNSVNESDGLGKTSDKLDVDVDCLCDHLGSIDDSFIDLNLKVSSLVESVDSLLCICSKIDDLISCINNKDFSITVQPSIPSVTVTNPVNNVTVEPCSPVITNPVNNITVQPSNPSVTVTNPVNNVTVEPCSPVVSPTDLSGLISALQTSLSALNSSLSANADALVCTDSSGNDEGLACILKNALNNRDDKGLADVIDDKDTSSYVDVAIEPYDLVNIRRAFNDDELREG